MQYLIFKDLDESIDEPVNISWPDTNKKRLTYLFLAPIVFPLWLTLPDTKTSHGTCIFENQTVFKNCGNKRTFFL